LPFGRLLVTGTALMGTGGIVNVMFEIFMDLTQNIPNYKRNKKLKPSVKNYIGKISECGGGESEFYTKFYKI
jgi:hypothetical protein